MAKQNIVTKKQLDEFRKKTGNPKAELRDFFNANKFDKTKGFVPRAKPLVRRKDKAQPVKPQVSQPIIIKDKSSDQSNYFDNRARTQSSYSSTDKSTKSAKPRVKGAKNLVTEDEKKRGSVFGMKEGGKVRGKTGTQSGKAEDIDARIEKLDKRYPRYRAGMIPSTGLRNERKKLDALQRKKRGLPRIKSKAEREQFRLLEEKIAKLKVKGKTGTQSGKTEDTKVRLEKLKDKYPIASKIRKGYAPLSSSIRKYQKEKDRLSKIGKRQDKEARKDSMVRKDNAAAAAAATRLSGLRADLTKEDREKKRAKIKSNLQDSFARIRGESKAQSSTRGGANPYTKYSPTNKAGGKVKKMKAGGMVKNIDGIAKQGKTRGRII